MPASKTVVETPPRSQSRLRLREPVFQLVDRIGERKVEIVRRLFVLITRVGLDRDQPRAWTKDELGQRMHR